MRVLVVEDDSDLSERLRGRLEQEGYAVDIATNGIDGDPNGDGRGIETHTLKIPAVTRLQEAYVRQVIDTVGDLDNVLYEIANESGNYSTEWQYHLIRYIREQEKAKAKRHPVGMTFQWAGNAKQKGTNKLLFDSPADWISPNPGAAGGHDYRTNPLPADGKKVILTDTDHLWGIGGNADWAWKSFLRGHNPIFMDPYDNRVLGKVAPTRWESLRASLGQTRRLAERVDDPPHCAAALTPLSGCRVTASHANSCSSRFRFASAFPFARTFGIGRPTGDRR